MSNDWKNQLGFDTPVGVAHDVQGKTQMFYPVSVRLLFDMKRIGSSLSKILAVLWPKSTENDKGVTTKSMNQQESKDEFTVMDENIVQSVNPSLASLRYTQREGAIKDFLDKFLDDETLLVFIRIIMDSLTDLFPRDSKKNPTPQQFFDSIPAPALYDFFAGVVKANKEVLSPLESLFQSEQGDLWKMMKDNISTSLRANLANKVENLPNEKEIEKETDSEPKRKIKKKNLN